MMKLVLAFYDEGVEALKEGAQVNDLVKLPVREKIGRYKYTLEDNLTGEYEAIDKELASEVADLVGKEDQ